MMMKGHLSVAMLLWILIQGPLMMHAASFMTGERGENVRSKRETSSNLITLDPENIIDIERKHNSLRNGVDPKPNNMMLMRWHEGLAMLAEERAEQCDLSIEGDPPHLEIDGVPLGLNFVDEPITSKAFKKGVKSKKAMETLVSRFVSGVGKIMFVNGPEYVFKQCQLYQMMEHSTTHFGCALANCTEYEALLFVCYYAPAPRTWDAPPYTAWDSSIDCIPAAKYKNLCDCNGTICLHGGSLDPYSCSCQCPLRWMGVECEIEDCTGVQCLNGGTLDSRCDCICPEEYTGFDCGEKREESRKCSRPTPP